MHGSSEHAGRFSVVASERGSIMQVTHASQVHITPSFSDGNGLLQSPGTGHRAATAV